MKGYVQDYFLTVGHETNGDSKLLVLTKAWTFPLK